ncbi:glutamate--tRNA ligase [Candidatus Chromulinivorax destructor]|uniref:Glutamate--tRNA ligase n=1 Tax=Candidatus Chromulinivorax destructor TaxID=2066483 RepID=A0A345ZAI7_9BACT|nr:glutamate--tRNA ligase [Candidatus Chromulinivorax destructor]AXK60304.1 glutamate--tRNA ligase [Candidatus Chromulinivorax destructor]
MNIKNKNKVRVRFAPSPTGFLHIGGLRTALFNWLFARHEDGLFLVRIEDTDRDRFSQEYEYAIVSSLQWAGIKADEPFVYQHARQSEHQKAVDELLAKGKAYYCFCSVDELQQKRESAQEDKETYIYDKTCRNKKPTKEEIKNHSYVVRFKVEIDDEILTFDDLIRGKVTLPTQHIDDFVITRSDGGMTYNFAVVVDDHFMRISHVIRGEDHIVNTGKQILLYKAFGWSVPQFGHVSLILGSNGQKLSKRDAAVGVQDYKDKGFLADALCNYLVRLGWSHGDQEVFTTDEMIKHFKIQDVSTSGAIFDYNKLLWLNSVYIKAKSAQELCSLINQNLEINLVSQTSAWSQSQLQAAITLYKDRSQTLRELVQGVLSLYHAPKVYDTESTAQWITPAVIEKLRILADELQYAHIDKIQLQEIVKTFAKDHDLKFPAIAQPMRIALIGSSHGPGIFDMIEILGKDEMLHRLQEFFKKNL